MTDSQSIAAIIATAIVFTAGGFAWGALWAWRGGGG